MMQTSDTLGACPFRAFAIVGAVPLQVMDNDEKSPGKLCTPFPTNDLVWNESQKGSKPENREYPVLFSTFPFPVVPGGGDFTGCPCFRKPRCCC